MKTFSIYTLLVAILMFSRCQSEEVAPTQIGNQKATLSRGFTPVMRMHGMPPDEVVRTDYTGATKWRVAYEDHGFHPWWHSQRYFSTSTGSFYSFDDLNNSVKATSRADIYFDFAYLKAPVLTDQYLDYGAQTRSTLFKTVNLSPWELAVMTMYTPDQFQIEFEERPAPALPNAPQGGQHMKSGDIFLFKTDELAPRYGAIRIIEKLGISTIDDEPFRIEAEIIVQADNNLIPLNN